MNLAKIEAGMKLVLEGLEVDLNDHNFATTPKRAAKVFEEVFCPPATEWPVFNENYTDMVILRGHTFFTFCPHHLLPVELKASVAYKPGGKVIGASKLVRMIHEANTKPLTQEFLTAAIIKQIKLLTQGTSLGEAILLSGEHGCFKIRGIKTNADMLTPKFEGIFAEDERLQDRFMNLVMGAHLNHA